MGGVHHGHRGHTPPEEADLLQLPPGVPILMHTRLTYDQDDRPVQYDQNAMRADRHVMDYDLPAEL
ncbi:UTRA domain-containing protein [Sphaerisporangium sp. NPDC051017]|uniref:UTRA domain-containing protein n=1 Tax=Sphaerisporangium sp. NPDC051017 TaxID=3154636 RepID=UPI00342841D1